MIPPSIVLIIYGLIASVSIADLFTAAFTPGTILMLLYVGYVLIRCIRNPALAPAMPPVPPEERRAQRREAIRSVVMPGMIAMMVLGTIYTGIASVTEAASMGVAGVLFATIVRRELSVRLIHEACMQTITTCGMIVWIGIGAATLVGVYNLMGGNRFVSQTILSIDADPVYVIMVMQLILIVLGMFLDWIGIAMLTLPIFVPIVQQLGYSPIWFGILFCVNMQVSFLSPPFGPAAFYLKGVAPPEISLKDIFSSLLPFIVMQLIVLALILFFPDIAMWPLKL